MIRMQALNYNGNDKEHVMMASIIYESRKHLGILAFVWVVVSPLKAEWQIIIKTAESRRLAEGEKGHGGLTTDWGCPRTKKPDMVLAF